MARIAATAMADIFAEPIQPTLTKADSHTVAAAFASSGGLQRNGKSKATTLIQLFCSTGTASGGMPPGADHFQAAAAFDRRLEP